MAEYTRFYLTKWKDEGDSAVCKLMERDGADDGTDAIVAEFSMHSAPLGERLAAIDLAAANADEDREDSHYDIGSIVPGDVKIRDDLEDPTARWRYNVVVQATAMILNDGKPACAMTVEGRAQFDHIETSGEATAEALKAALENCRQAARTYCAVYNGAA
ncbi:hypothetical protein H0176_00560 [Methylorubrum populi]|uniref:Uncharacterized protein n=1 Tax=Methylorubrum rhodesianum TaxID=29427 RepID=A0ABU9Z5D3_9HYPH|nr:hypothetical protein [Methylorubrum rhodesianum]MBK3405092.1 hypothetical protein [Methylorubrum rhodesianum]MBY0138774.1 hypothetical protein [Methylorubrum populi]